MGGILLGESQIRNVIYVELERNGDAIQRFNVFGVEQRVQCIQVL